jgi:hypothetical protein
MEERIRARLRSFGRGLAIVLALVAAISWRRHKLHKAEVEAGLAALSALLAQLWPEAFYWPERVWMPVANALEKINTTILMGAIYFLVVTPVAFLQRLFGSDVLDERLSTAESYWKPKKPNDDPARYERPY